MKNLLVLTGGILLLIITCVSAKEETKSNPPVKTIVLTLALSKGNEQTITTWTKVDIDNISVSVTPSYPAGTSVGHAPEYLENWSHKNMTIYADHRQKISQKVLDVNNGRPVKVERTYKESFLSDKNDNDSPHPFNGKTISMVLKDGKTVVKGDMPDNIKELVSLNDYNFDLLLPTKPVMLNDKWEVVSGNAFTGINFATLPKKLLPRHGGPPTGLNAYFNNGKLVCCLKEVTMQDKDQIAVIDISGKLEGDDTKSHNGIPHTFNQTVTLEGKAYFSVAKGRFTNVEFKGVIDIEGNQNCVAKPERLYKVIGNGTFSINVQFE